MGLVMGIEESGHAAASDGRLSTLIALVFQAYIAVAPTQSATVAMAIWTTSDFQTNRM